MNLTQVPLTAHDYYRAVYCWLVCCRGGLTAFDWQGQITCRLQQKQARGRIIGKISPWGPAERSFRGTSACCYGIIDSI